MICNSTDASTTNLQDGGVQRARDALESINLSCVFKDLAIINKASIVYHVKEHFSCTNDSGKFEISPENLQETNIEKEGYRTAQILIADQTMKGGAK